MFGGFAAGRRRSPAPDAPAGSGPGALVLDSVAVLQVALEWVIAVDLCCSACYELSLPAMLAKGKKQKWLGGGDKIQSSSGAAHVFSIVAARSTLTDRR